MKRGPLIFVGFTVLLWFCVAWAMDNWYWTASLLYATVLAVFVAFIVAAFGRPRYRAISLGFALSCGVPLASKLFAKPGRLLGYAVLPVDVSHERRNLADVLFVLCIGVISATVAHYVARRTATSV